MTQVSRDSSIRLGDVFRVVGGGTPSTQIAEYWNGKIPWVTSADIDERHQITPRKQITREAIESSATNLVPKGSVIVVTRVGLGKVAEAPIDLCFSQDCHALLFDHGMIDPRFVVHQLSRSTQVFNYVSRGTTISGVTKKQLLDLDFWLPSLSEQRRIVAKIEEQFTRLETGVAALKRVQANLKRYRIAIADEAARHESCQEVLLVNLLREGFKTGLSVKQSDTGTVPSLKLSAIRNGQIDFTFSKLLPVSLDEVKDILLQRGDFLVSRGNGSIRLVGTGALVRITPGPTIYPDLLIRVRVKPELLNPEWLNIIWGSGLIRGQIERKAKTTAGIYKISQHDLGSIKLRVPPLDAQAYIVEAVARSVSVVEELEAQVHTDLARADRLRHSILENAFRERRTPKAVNTVVPFRKQPAEVPRTRRHFARAVLSAEIVHQLHAEPTFGRIKHQKIFHLCEHIAKLNEIQGQYHREAAGPLDNKLIYANEAELKKQSWYGEVPRSKYGHAYRPLVRAGGHEKYLERLWPRDKLATIEELIKLMRRWDTDRCEIFSTTYAAWNDLLLWGQETTDEAILQEVLDNWHESKQRFPEVRWRKAIEWMREKGFAPTGFGKPTRKQK